MSLMLAILLNNGETQARYDSVLSAVASVLAVEYATRVLIGDFYPVVEYNLNKVSISVDVRGGEL